jgi:hypothetical protein
MGEMKMGTKNPNCKTHSKYFGVSRHNKNAFQSTVIHNKKLHYLGYYKNEVDAALAYDRYVTENKLTKRLNFPIYPENNIPNTRLIQLTQGKFAIVDEEDYERVNAHKWSASNLQNIWYAIGMVSTGNKILMHRFILNTDIAIIDHYNRNGLHNYKSNLRPCNASQNIVNSEKRKGCSSIYKGVVKDKRCNSYSARISFKGKNEYLGYFNDEIEAAKAYDAKAKELYGEFAILNFPEQQSIINQIKPQTDGTLEETV